MHRVQARGDDVNENQHFALMLLVVVSLATLMSIILLVIGLSEKGVCVG